MELKTGVNINTGELQTERHGYFFYIYIYIHIQTDINIAEKIQFKENYVWNCNSSPLSKIPVKNPLVLISNILPLNSGDITESLEIYSVPCSTKKIKCYLKVKKIAEITASPMYSMYSWQPIHRYSFQLMRIFSIL